MTDEVFTLTDNIPEQTPCPPSGMSWAEGVQVAVFVDNGLWYGYLFGVNNKGLYWEGDTYGPYYSRLEAIKAMIERYENTLE